MTREATWKILRENYIEELCDMIENGKHKTQEYETLIEEFSEILKIKRKFAKVDQDYTSYLLEDGNHVRVMKGEVKIKNIEYSSGDHIYEPESRTHYIFIGILENNHDYVVKRLGRILYKKVSIEFFDSVIFGGKTPFFLDSQK